jgi:ABC-type spermidine/putrescine transport system permease subunit II
MSLVATALVTWQLIRLGLNSFRTEDVAPTPLATPLWMPQTSMGIGMALLCLALLRSIAVKVKNLSGGGAR